MDKNLAFMKELDNEQLGIFVEVMLKKGNLTEMLSVSEEYKLYGKKYNLYWNRIEKEFLDFGSNTITSAIFGNKDYKAILIDVADKLKINFNKEQSVENIEGKILEKVLVDAWENMSEEEKRDLAESAKSKHGKMDLYAEGAAGLVWIFRAGGFASYKISLIIINAIAKMILGRGLSLVANATFVRALSIFAGPIGIAVTALWTIFDIAGPAYRVTIPCVILIAAFRHEMKLKEYRNFEL